VVFIIVYFSMW